MTNSIDPFRLWLSCLPGIGPATLERLFYRYGNAGRIYTAAATREAAFCALVGESKATAVCNFTRDYDPGGAVQTLVDNNITFVTIDDAEYPERLRGIERPPYALFVKGRLPENGRIAVAMVGARSCSEYGRYTAEEFGRYLAAHGINVISGMARGIDGISQQGALLGGGSTFAVLGSGVDVCYPASNRALYEEIQKTGGILSIFPPGREPLRQQFPERNRIVAALSDIVLVIEARAKSGTSNTVEHAIALGKEVYAVPGRITDRLSDGCNMLLRQGAGIALSPEDMVREAQLLQNRGGRRYVPAKWEKGKQTAGRKKKSAPMGILDCVDAHPRSLEEIYARYRKGKAGLTLAKTQEELVKLVLSGELMQVGSGYFYRKLTSSS